MGSGNYYLGRVVKINLSQDELMDAISNAPTISMGKFDWTITDVIDHRNSDSPYIFGKLSKYAKDGHAKVIDEISRSQVEADVPNLLEASSPFVYLPEYSGIAYLHVWNGIQEEVFPRRFKTVIESSFDGFMVSADIDPVSDYLAFTSRLKKLEYFTEFSATVNPPNPMFGRLWGELNKYIDERNSTEVSLKESSSKKDGVKSNIIELMDEIMKNPDYSPDMVPSVVDAALLMAADGYGRGKVVGVQSNEEVVIKTSDTQINFKFSKDPDPDELAIKAREVLYKVKLERDMGH